MRMRTVLEKDKRCIGVVSTAAPFVAVEVSVLISKVTRFPSRFLARQKIRGYSIIIVFALLLTGILVPFALPTIPSALTGTGEPSISNSQNGTVSSTRSTMSSTTSTGGLMTSTMTDRQYIQSLIDAAPDYSTINLPAGTFVIDCPTRTDCGSLTYNVGLSISFKNGITLKGAGPSSTIIKQAPNQYDVNGCGSVMLLCNDYNGLTIEGIGFDGNRANNPGVHYDGAASLYTFGHQSNLVVTNCAFYSAPDTGMYIGNNANSYSIPNDGEGWCTHPMVTNCHFSDNLCCGLFHDACRGAYFNNLLFENDPGTSRRSLYMEGNVDYLTYANNAVVSNVTFIESDIRFYNINGYTVTNLNIYNPNLVEPGASCAIVQSKNVHIQIGNLTREVSAGAGYGVTAGYETPGTQIKLTGTITAQIGVATVNMGDDLLYNPADSDCTFSGGTIVASQKAFYSTGLSSLFVRNSHVDTPANKYGCFLADESTMNVGGISFVRSDLFYKDAGATYLNGALWMPTFTNSPSTTGKIGSVY